MTSARSGRRIASHGKGVLLVFGAAGGTKAWRVDFPLNALLRGGEYAEAVSVRDFLRAWLPRLRLGIFDVCVFHRVQFSDSIAQAVRSLKEWGVTVVADFDDALFSQAYAGKLVEEEKAVAGSARREAANHLAMLSAADHCTASTRPLRDMIAAAPAERVGLSSVLPNCFSDELFSASLATRRGREGYARSDIVSIGYASGSASHNRDFAMLRPVLTRLLAKHSQLRLIVVGDLEFGPFADEFAGRIEKIGLLPHQELAVVLGRFDINVVPLVEDMFNECKSAIKFIEAALVGVPTVASATAPYVEAVEHERTGFVARSADDWEQHLETLVLNADRRRAIGQAAAEACAFNYSPEAWRRCFGSLRDAWRAEARPVSRSTVFAVPNAQLVGEGAEAAE